MDPTSRSMDGHTFKLQGRAVRLSTCEPDGREPHRVPVRISPCDTVQHYSYLLGPLLNSLAENVLFKHKSPIAQAHGRDNPSPDVLGLWVVKKKVPSPRVPLWDSRSRAYFISSYELKILVWCCMRRTRRPFSSSAIVE